MIFTKSTYRRLEVDAQQSSNYLTDVDSFDEREGILQFPTNGMIHSYDTFDGTLSDQERRQTTRSILDNY